MKQYFIALGGETLGPFDIDELKENGLKKNTLVWCEGMSEWQEAGTLTELDVIFDTPQAEASPVVEAPLPEPAQEIDTVPAPVSAQTPAPDPTPQPEAAPQPEAKPEPEPAHTVLAQPYEATHKTFGGVPMPGGAPGAFPPQQGPITGGNQQQWPITGGNQQQWPITGGNQQQWPITGGNQQQWPTTGGNHGENDGYDGPRTQQALNMEPAPSGPAMQSFPPMPGNGLPNMPGYIPPQPKFKTWMTEAIILTVIGLLFGMWGGLLGIVATTFAYDATEAAKIGNMFIATKCANRAALWCKIGAGVTVVAFLLWIFVFKNLILFLI